MIVAILIRLLGLEYIVDVRQVHFTYLPTKIPSS